MAHNFLCLFVIVSSVSHFVLFIFRHSKIFPNKGDSYNSLVSYPIYGMVTTVMALLFTG